MSDSVAELLPPNTLDGFDRLRGDCGLFILDKFSVIEISGEDRKGWLQGQATNDLKQLDLGASSAFCICQPTGQILAVCDIWGLKDRFILTCEAIAAPALLSRIDQMVILEDVVARDLTADYDFFSLQGPNASSALNEVAILPTLDAADSRIRDHDAIVLRSNRTGLGGWDILVPKVAGIRLQESFPLLGDEVMEIARLEAGIPRMGVDIDSKTFPPELGSAFEARHISYRKGCYTGQEVLMRIHSRGHTNKTWMGLSSEHELPIGAPIVFARDREVGTVTSACYSPDYGFIGAGFIRNEAALDGEEVLVAGSAATVRQMPILRFD